MFVAFNGVCCGAKIDTLAMVIFFALHLSASQILPILNTSDMSTKRFAMHDDVVDSMKSQLLILVDWAKYIPCFCDLALDEQVSVNMYAINMCVYVSIYIFVYVECASVKVKPGSLFCLLTHLFSSCSLNLSLSVVTGVRSDGNIPLVLFRSSGIALL